MRILHLVKSFSFGGAENHVRDLANILDETGHQVFIAARQGKQNSLLRKGVRFFDMCMNDLTAPLRIYQVVKLIRENRIEIIHAHQRLPLFIGCVAGKITGIPVIVTVHGQVQYDVRSFITRRWSDKFIFVRQTSFDESGDYGIPAGKALLIQNGVTIMDATGERDHFAICYISRTDKRHSQLVIFIIKNVLTSLVSEFQEVTFNIVGDGDYLDDIKAEAQMFNNRTGKEIVIVHGYKPDIREVILKSGLVLGVGRVAIETLACGIPVLSVNQKYFGGLVTVDNYPFFRKNNFVAYGGEPPDENKLLHALKTYLSNTTIWQNEALKLQKAIDEDFNIYRITASIVSIYEEEKRLKNKNKRTE